MKVGFAVQGNDGVESRVYGHFGSAPAFIIVDTEGKDVLTANTPGSSPMEQVDHWVAPPAKAITFIEQ